MSRKLWGGAATGDARHAREIYGLCDPRDNLIYYVGMSVDAQKRYQQHLYGCLGNDKYKQWMNELKKLGLTPILVILETIDKGPHAYDLAIKAEELWISKLLKDGQPLLNIYGITRRYSSE